VNAISLTSIETMRGSSSHDGVVHRGAYDAAALLEALAR
jgi:hypothetical protein